MIENPMFIANEIKNKTQKSQQVLAELIGIEQSTFSRIASGVEDNPRLNTYKKLLDYWQKINLIENGE